MKRIQIKKTVLPILLLVILLAIFPFGHQEPIKYINRETGLTQTEKVPGESWLIWLYQNPIGEATLYTLVKRKFLSEIYGNMMDSPRSKSKIEPFIHDYEIDMNISQQNDFETFNDFFIRKLKPEARPINNDSSIVVSPADGKVLAYQNIKNQDFIVKGFRFNTNEFLQNDQLVRLLEDGSLLIFRLCPTDYHRYHFPLDGEVLAETEIDGDYYSVSPIALREKIELLTMNKRSYCTIKTDTYGTVVMAEVAATMVGSMVNTYEGTLVQKGEERGYFKFGGSTVILFFEKNQIEIDPDLIQNTMQGLETTIKMGEQIASEINK